MDTQSWAEKKEYKRNKKQEKAIKFAEHLEEEAKIKEQAKLIQQENDANESETKGEIKPVSTISIAVPGSILDNAQSPELRTYLAGQIARAACIYNVDEVIVFDDNAPGNMATAKMAQLETVDGNKIARPCCIQFARILQYLECPQYLRKFFFPIHNDLKFTGLLNPLDAQHHVRAESTFYYREGIVSPKKHTSGSFVNVGLLNDVLVDKPLPSGLRVTIKLPKNADQKSKKLRGKVVPPSEPRNATGIYWGYNVRVANSISQVFSQSPYKDGYDCTIGTSDKGENIEKVESKSLKYNHMLIVFGGLYGLENAVENDENLSVDDPSLLFDSYFNVAPQQGSRTIRTEEAVLITLAALSDKVEATMQVKSFEFKELIAQSTDTGKQQLQEPMKRKNKNKDPAKKRMKNVAEFDDNDDAPENDSAPPNDFAPVREFVPAKEFVAKEYVAKEQTIVDDDMSRFD
ncbi:unnamed protein product [Diamesa serratosioi]